MPRNDRRRAERVPANNLVTYSAVRADRLFKLLGLAMTLDVSETGLRVKTQEPLPIGEEISFTLKLGEALHRVSGRVIWGSELEPERSYESGVRFKNLDFGLATDLWKLAERALAANPDRDVDEQVEVDQLVQTLARKLGAETPRMVGPKEREMLRKLCDGISHGSTVTGREPRNFERPLLHAVAEPGAGAKKDLILTLRPDERKPYRERVPTPKPRGTVGHFEGDQLIEFVQMLGLQSKTGVLEVTWRRGGGHLALRDGQVIAARTQANAVGERAVNEILSCEEGHFDFWPHRLESVATEHSLAVQPLLLEILRRRDEPH